MKNNTKLIMETWRRFLSEGPQDDPGQFRDPGDPDLEGAQVTDPDLEGDIALLDQMNSDPEHEAYNPQGVGEDSYHDVPFDPMTQGGPDDFNANVAAIRGLIEEQGLSDEQLLRLKYTHEEIEEARLQHQEELPGTMLDDHEALSSETGGDYSSQDAELERSSLGMPDRDY